MTAARQKPYSTRILPSRHAALAMIAGLAVIAHANGGARDGGTNSAHAANVQSATFSTLATTPLVIEGLTGDRQGNLYAAGRSPGAGLPCPVWRIPAGGGLTIVGNIPAPGATGQCSPSGIAFNAAGNLFVSDGDRVYTLAPDAGAPPTATVYTGGVPGTNGLAFDKAGNLWTGDGTTGQGRVWKIAPGGTVVTEMFRVQPMANEVNLVDGVGGVGRDVRSLPGGKITVTPASRNAADTAASQAIVVNGLAFTSSGNLLIADTARGAIWKAEFDAQGNVRSKTGCDTTFTANTLCLTNVLVAHPLLEGADGIAMDAADNVIASVNERNAIVQASKTGEVTEIFRNAPDPATRLRDTGPLEFPSSPFLSGSRLCTANADSGRRDNVPATAGELGGAGQPKGKISCMDQPRQIPGQRPPF